MDYTLLIFYVIFTDLLDLVLSFYCLKFRFYYFYYYFKRNYWFYIINLDN